MKGRRGFIISHASSCGSGDAPLHAACHTHGAIMHQHHLIDLAAQAGCSNPTSQVGTAIASKGGVITTEVGAKTAAKVIVKSAAKSATKVTTKVATKATTKLATKASAKTTTKVAFEAGSEAAISGTLLGAIGGVAFGVSLLLETPLYIRGAYKLHRKKKFDIISKEEHKREMIKMTFMSVNTVVGGTLGAVAGQAAIPVPVLGAVIGGFVGGIAGQACGYLEGKALSSIIRDPTKVTLPVLNTPMYGDIEQLEAEAETKIKPKKLPIWYTEEEQTKTS